MSKKVLNSNSVINELKGQSVYFRKEPEEEDSRTVRPKPEIQEPEKIRTEKHPHEPEQEQKTEEAIPQTHAAPEALHGEKKDDTLNENANKHDSMPASTLASNQDDIVETIRKTVKQVGKDTLFIRLTPEEKHELTSIVFAFNELYRGESRKTSENEIGRIALSFLLEDYRTHGKESMLAKVLAALIA